MRKGPNILFGAFVDVLSGWIELRLRGALGSV
jgi:hypothetical protein